MKSILTLICSVFLLISCEVENNNSNQLSLTGKLVDNSACKSDLKSTSETIYTPDSLSCIEYSFDLSSNKITLKHINAGFNCCPDSMYCNVSLVGDTILIKELEKSALCNCNCLYDLDIEVNGVEPKVYQIKFVEPCTSEMQEINFEIDLAKAENGSKCVIRKKYPWGLISLNE